MTWTTPNYLQDPAAQYAAVNDRFVIDTLFAEGIMNVAAGQGLAVQRPAGASMQVWVPPLDCIIKGDDAAGQGSYLARLTVGELVDITAAPTTNPRIDLIVAEVIDSQYRTISTANPLGSRLRVIAGTPAASPVVPTLPATAIPIARVAVAVNASTITTANITDLRTQSGSSGYAPQAPAMTTAQRNAISNPSVGYMIFNTTTSKQETYGGSTLGWLAGASVDIQTFSVSGTWTKPANARVVFLDVVSGGGGGGCGANQGYPGFGGGGGGRRRDVIPASTLASSVAVTVGAGGTGAAAGSAAAGASGGQSAFGSYAVTGGTGGPYQGYESSTRTPGGRTGPGVVVNTPYDGGDGLQYRGSGGVAALYGAGAGGNGGAAGAAGGPGGTSGELASGATGVGGSGGTTSANPTAGTAGGNSVTGAGAGGGGGGGSNGSNTTYGYGAAGGNGGFPGGGGGGSGYSYGQNSAKGGDGAAGQVTVITICA